tara:strand:+ start:1153 stop:1296 length:144 start_codon:yes stop_codon:yes gene_type:complete
MQKDQQEEEKTEEKLETSESEPMNSTSYLFDDTPSYSLWDGICENPF